MIRTEKESEVMSTDKYRGTYRVYRTVDKYGNLTTNENDTYIKAKAGVQVYRYNDTTLAVMFVSNKYASNRIKELTDIGVNLTPFVQGDDESVYLFSESDFDKVSEILKPMTKGKNKSPKSSGKKIKRKFTEEQKERSRERIKLIREKLS